MHYVFSLAITTTTAHESLRLATLAERKIVEIPGVLTSHVVPNADDPANKLEDYAEKIERLSATLALVARDYDGPAPYGATLSRLRKNGIRTPDDAVALNRLEELSARAPVIARMRRFLVELPADSVFDNLRFLQELVTANLDLSAVTEHPEKIDGPVLQAFEEYHAEYVRLYRGRLYEREDNLKTLKKRYLDIEEQLATITALDDIRALGIANAPVLTREFEEFTRHYTSLAISPNEINHILTVEPVIGGITFFSPNPILEFEDLATRITEALATKLTRIIEAGTAKILASSTDPTVKKFTQLLSLTQLNEITKLFTKKTTPKIVHELKKLFDDDERSTISLGDFTPKLRALHTAADAKKLEKEFSTWLTKKITTKKSAVIV